MYEFRIEAADKAELYRQLNAAAAALTDGEPDAIANMANVSALLWESLPDLNWAGFYRNVGGELVLGPVQGRAACIRLSFRHGGRGARGQPPPPHRPPPRPRLPGAGPGPPRFRGARPASAFPSARASAAPPRRR